MAQFEKANLVAKLAAARKRTGRHGGQKSTLKLNPRAVEVARTMRGQPSVSPSMDSSRGTERHSSPELSRACWKPDPGRDESCGVASTASGWGQDRPPDVCT